MSDKLVHWWYQRRLAFPLWLLTPFSALFTVLAGLRRFLFWARIKKRYVAPVPVVVVGNVTVGGTGKTPTVLAIIEHLQQQGFKPGVVSRGYGGRGPFPALVQPNDESSAVGDEPLMLAKLSQVPVAVAPARAQAVKLLLAQTDIDVVIADDGLQHYALGRDIELGVVDGQRGFGNGWRLPAGPLRESVRRLRKVDWVLLNGQLNEEQLLPTGIEPISMSLEPVSWRRVSDDSVIERPDGETAIVIAGIGHPERFFNHVKAGGISIAETRVYPDHYAYQSTDFYDISNQFPVLMTEKDAVKVRAFARPHWYYLKVQMTFPADFLEQLTTRVRSVVAEKENGGKGATS